MIKEEDVEVLLRAKKDSVAISVLMGLSMLCLLTLILLEVAQVGGDYTVALATMCSVLIGSAVGVNKWVSVSREKLIKTLEDIVNRDANALQLLAGLQNNNDKKG